MPGAARFIDMASDHDGAPSTKAIEASPDVLVDGVGAVRQGDAFEPHAKPKESDHNRNLKGGSATVFINGKPAGRAGDAVSCGGEVAGGSSTVFIGD